MLLQLFTKPTAEQAARTELAEAELALLEARSGLEYAQAMVTYHQARVERLTAYVERIERERAEERNLSAQFLPKL